MKRKKEKEIDLLIEKLDSIVAETERLKAKYVLQGEMVEDFEDKVAKLESDLFDCLRTLQEVKDFELSLSGTI